MTEATTGTTAPARRARRAGMGRVARVPAAQFVQGDTAPGLVAEHGFAASVTTRRGHHTHTLLFDTGVSPPR